MKKRAGLLTFLLICIFSMTGCSFFPTKKSAKTVEKVAQVAINPDVHLCDEEVKSEKNYATYDFTYTFEDANGVRFEVKAGCRNASFVDPISFLYEDFVEYRTNYKDAIWASHKEEIDQILQSVNIISFEQGIIKVDENLDVEALADALIEIDELCNYQYAYKDKTRTEIDGDFWEAYNPFDLLVRNGSKQVNVLFSNGSDIKLSKDELREKLQEIVEQGDDNL